MCTKFIEKVTKIKAVTSRRKPHICKWAFLQVLSLTLWFRSCLSLIMWIIKDKTKIYRIIDPTLDLNERRNMQSLNKRYYKHFQKSVILKGSKKEPSGIPIKKLVVENIC